MAKKDIEKTLPDAAAPAAGKGKHKLIILIVLVLLLAISLSVGGTWLFLSKGDQKDEAKPETVSGGQAAPVKQAAIYEMLTPAFIVNFNYKGRQRYMQVSIALMARDQALLDALKVHMPVLRNNLVMLFSGQDFDSLATPVGKEMLRQLATASVQELAQKETGNVAIEQVLFTNFVLQ